MTLFEWREILSPHGHRTGCFRWYFGDDPMCDHEHDDEERFYTCEDARTEMASVRARLAADV